jgi:hypothetical protein
MWRRSTVGIYGLLLKNIYFLVLIVFIASRRIYCKKTLSVCLEFLYAFRRTNVTNILQYFFLIAPKEIENEITGMRKRYTNILHIWSEVNVSIPVYLNQDISAYIYRSIAIFARVISAPAYFTHHSFTVLIGVV